MPIKYIGKTVDYKGKTLWEIIGNLKNFGLGRIVTRSMTERYPEPSYMKIVKVETLPTPEFEMPDDVRKVRIFVEKIFRGRKYSHLVRIERASYKADYKLIPKDEEEQYCKFDCPTPQPKIVPKTISFPPLVRELIIREMLAKGQHITEEPQLKIIYNKGRDSFYRVAEDNEKPTVDIIGGFGTPAAPNLYKGLKL